MKEWRIVVTFLSRRGLFRIAALSAAILVCLSFHIWPVLDVLPALSPFVSALSAIARREIALPLALLGLPLTVLAFFRGRWFCFWLCPVGTLADFVARDRPLPRRFLQHRGKFARFLALAGLAGSAFGWPLVLWLDPLAFFGSAVAGIATVSISLLHILAIWPLALALGISIVWPRAWCDMACPLGAVQAWLGKAGCFVRCRCFLLPQTNKNTSLASGATMEELGLRITRRKLVALGAGFAAGCVLRFGVGRNPSQVLIRPPGAGDEERFLRLCIRCGRCFQACERHLIHPDPGKAGWIGLLAPNVRIGPDYCGEWCNDCCRVCPTGALAALTLDEKRRTRIGEAMIDKNTCIAWRQGEACMVCQEFCPYLAIRGNEQNNVNCPEVDATRCRGCGACQTACPALPTPAIVVHGLARQSLAPPVEADQG